MSGEEFTLSRKDIEFISRVASQAILQHLQLSGQEEVLQNYVIIPESLITETLNLDLLASSVHGVTDPFGQLQNWLSGFISSVAQGITSFVDSVVSTARNAIISAVNSASNAIINALADYTARVIARLIDYMGPRFAELGYAIANVIREISGAIAAGVTAITNSITSAIINTSTALSGAIASLGTSLSAAIASVGASLGNAIASLGTSLATQIANVSFSLAQSIAAVGTALSATVTNLGHSLGQAIAAVATSVSIGFSSIGAAISGAVTSIITTISTSVTQLATSLSVAINQVATSVTTAILQVSSGLSQAIASLSGAVSVGFTQLGNAIATSTITISSAISTGIGQIGTIIANVAGTLAATISTGVHLLSGKVDVAINIMTNFFPRFTEALSTNLSRMSETISNSLGKVSDAIRDLSTKMTDAITNNTAKFIQTVREQTSLSIQAVLESSQKITETLLANADKTINAIIEWGKKTSDFIVQVQKNLTDAILDSYQRTANALRDQYEKFMNALRDQYTKLSQALDERHKATVDRIIETGKKTVDFINDALSKFVDTITANLEKFMKSLTESMNLLSDTLKQIAWEWQGFNNALLQLHERFKSTARAHAEAVWEVLFLQRLPGWKVVWDEVPAFFQASDISAFRALMTILKSSAKVRPYATVTLGNPEKISVQPSLLALGGLQAEAPLLVTSPSLFFEPLISAFVRFIEPAVNQLWDVMSKAITNLVNALMGALSTIANTIVEGVKNFVGWVRDSILGAVAGLYEVLGSAGDLIKQVYESQFSKIPEGMSKVASMTVAPLITELLKLVGIKPEKEDPSAMLTKWGMSSATLVALPVIAQFPVRLAAHAIYTIGQFFLNNPLPVSIDLRPIGIGISIQFDISKAFGAALSHIAAEMKEYIDIISRGIAYGFGIWITQPMTRIVNYHMRNFVPVALPTQEMLTEIARRSMSLDPREFQDKLNLVKLYAMIEGYPDIIIDALYSVEEKYYVTITDRFGQKRKIPLSLMYVLPSVSDVARMVVRDIITGIEDLKTMFKARGMNEDIAVMYYLLHFRYPPPERLWTFYTRGISGLLWATLSQVEAKEVADEVVKVKAFMPVSPKDLNFQASTLEHLLKTYMKWHDYARFAYGAGWPSDNLIVIDTLADIPTKIDQRWMVRFGLYQFMSERGLVLTSPAKEFATKVIDSSPKSKILLDLTNFCRTLQATGLHPYYVPITAVAETINAITDERTLLRTGVINLFKEGFFDTSSVMRMLTGLLTTSFAVAYFDADTGQWKTGYINVPLRYLEMEARLIGLRAIMDRALDILRDIQKDILTGYQEFIIETYEEFKDKFAKVIGEIGSVFEKDFERVAGEAIPQELKLRFIDEYYKPYVQALSIWRDIYTVRRIRLWTQRWLGWLMFRIAYGVVKQADVEELVKFMVKAARLPEEERKYIQGVMEFMMKLSLREYIPTPMQLATLAEYVRISDAQIMKALQDRMVPADWAEVWFNYIRVRPIADDVRGLLTAYRRLLVFVKREDLIPKDIASAVRTYMAKIGYTEEEMAIFDLRVKIEEMIAAMREYVPTPMQLATLAEFVKLPANLIERSFEVRNVPREWRDIWLAYINVRPLADDVRELIRSFFRALAYTPDAKRFEGLVKSYAARIGFGEDELAMLNARIELEEMIYGSRQYIPTPLQLATIAEILPRARDFFDSVVRRHRIPPEWQSLWSEYIDIKPLVDDLKRYLSRAEQLYINFMVKRDDFIRMIRNVISRLGYTTDEENLLLQVTELERWRNAWREIIGTVDRLVALSEYSPRAARYALAKVEEMIDALPLSPSDKEDLKAMWREYIRNRPVKAEARTYITQLINAYVDGLISDTDLRNELNRMKEWGFSDAEIDFYLAQAAVRKARKLRIPLIPS